MNKEKKKSNQKIHQNTKQLSLFIKWMQYGVVVKTYDSPIGNFGSIPGTFIGQPGPSPSREDGAAKAKQRRREDKRRSHSAG